METSRGYLVAGQARICHALPCLALPLQARPGQAQHARPSMPGASGLLEVSTGVLVRMVMLCCRGQQDRTWLDWLKGTR